MPVYSSRMEMFHDEKLRKELIVQVWSHFCTIEPDLLIWKLGENMLSVNKHLLHKDHFIFRKCFGAMWMKGFEARLLPGSPKGELSCKVLCRVHEKVELVRFAKP